MPFRAVPNLDFLGLWVVESAELFNNICYSVWIVIINFSLIK